MLFFVLQRIKELDVVLRPEVVNFLVVDIEIHVLVSRSKECSMLCTPAYVIHIGFHSRSDFLLLIIMRQNLFICLLDTL